MLKSLAPTLERLELDGNKLGGTITDDIAAFTKLTELFLWRMDLKPDNLTRCSPFNIASSEMRSRAQGCCRSRSSA